MTPFITYYALKLCKSLIVCISSQGKLYDPSFFLLHSLLENFVLAKRNKKTEKKVC